MRLTLFALALLITAGCSADRSALPTKPRAGLDAITRGPAVPLTHEGPVGFEPDRALPTFTVRSPKRIKFAKGFNIIGVQFRPARGNDNPPFSGGAYQPYRHVQLGGGVRYYTGSGCCASPFAAWVKPHEVQVWFEGVTGPGTLTLRVGSQLFDVPIPAVWPEERVHDIHECVTLWPDFPVVLPCGVEPE